MNFGIFHPQIFYAILECDKLYLRLILLTEDVNIRDIHGETPLEWAADTNDPEIIKMLVAAGAVVNTFDVLTRTPLYKAVRGNRVKAAGALVEAGAEVNIADRINGETLLHHAASRGYMEMVKLLIGAGAFLNPPDSLRMTPLHKAAGHGFTGTVKALLEAGANVNEMDRFREAPLHMAARSGHTETVMALLEATADVNTINDCVTTACHAARSNDHEACAEYLRFVSGPWTLGWKSNLAKMPGFVRKRAFMAILCLRSFRLDPYIIREVLCRCHL